MALTHPPSLPAQTGEARETARPRRAHTPATSAHIDPDLRGELSSAYNRVIPSRSAVLARRSRPAIVPQCDGHSGA